MHNNEISMWLDVKMEVKDKHFEMLNLRAWTKSYVKIEAIKCFPCYIKLTFLQDRNETHSNRIIRINLPGLHVQMAMSRTKNYAYGLFWKNNRKRNTAFFGFESKQNCEEHMKWIKMSINNLELHRQEILQSRRSSRYPVEKNDWNVSKDTLQIYQNLHETQDIKDVNDILGPLPCIPSHNDGNWSRRVSGLSEIYEEIPEPFNIIRQNRRVSRTSMTSGIYEEMKPVQRVLNLIEPNSDATDFHTPPPLPPRTRVNTLESDDIRRSYTNPESNAFLTNRGRNVSENVSSSSVKLLSNDRKSNLTYFKDSVILRRQKLIPRVLDYDLLELKRNSFSSPDLTKFNQHNDDSSIDDFDCSSKSGSNDIRMYENNNVEVNAAIKLEDTSLTLSSNKENEEYNREENFNISDRIQSNFNFSNINSSTINLIGSNVVLVDEEEVVLRKRSIDYDIGYIVMNPPLPDKKSSKVSMSSTTSSKVSNSTCTTSSSVWSSDKSNSTTIDPCFDIKFRFEATTTSISSIQTNSCSSNFAIYENLIDTESDSQYVDMTRTKLSNSNNKTISEDYSIYDSPKRLLENNSSNSTDSSKNGSISSNSRQSFDDKIPSYYPNNYKKITTTTGNNKHIKSENVYLATPKLINKKINKNNNSKKIKGQQPANLTNVYIVNKEIPPAELSSSKSTSSLFLSHDIENSSKPINQQPIAQRIYQKYATLSRASNKYIDKAAKSASPKIYDNSSKKFTTLPRFRKIDLSPLKLKINNVLQRHNSES